MAVDKTSVPASSCRLLPLKSTLSSLYLLTSFFGHKNCFHHKCFRLGLGIWVTNILIHFVMDFYEAYAIFGTAWATVIGMYLITFIVASSTLAKTTLPWLENSLIMLHESGHYPETLRYMRIILKVAPVVVICMGCAGGAGQYTCYYVDGATRLDFNDALPHWLVIFLNIVRFTSLLHMFCGYSLFLVIPVSVAIISHLSMKEFKSYMDKELQNLKTNMTFGTAVTLFEERVCFISESSKSCSMLLVILVMSSTLSFTLNVYNFLFVQRLAVYFWFAVLPLLWIAIPLAVGAWATDTYQTFAGVVLKNWARTSGDNSSDSSQGMVTSDVSPEMACITCRDSARAKLSNKISGCHYASKKFRTNLRNVVVRPLQIEPSAQNACTVQSELTEDIKNMPCVDMVEPAVASKKTDQWTCEAEVLQLRPESVLSGESIGLRSNPGYPADRFDFERYIIYLQCLLPDVGFSVAGCLLTWDKVFGLAVFMISLAAVFIQEVMFGSRKNTIGRP
ncbi:uncharacterized protein LOC114532605 [Dendronephthya gigantea]|uniref:uncharacterized protein LOC114532605 n=1 Tax=Dendronephthya gigantea TaxID=151771 RepID=UPI00106D6606|nr:uncharacterized protein LOC114532605 [Dendronephthya gigantea]